tara:strand:+ start:123303 stop:125717 length:2415 start_codon:yes stop_codon:yes gene_type:complete
MLGFFHIQMSVRHAAFAIVAIACVVNGLQPTSAQDDLQSLDDVDAFVTNHCLDCHNEADAAGELNLETFDIEQGKHPSADWNTATWEKMVRRLRGRQMPPPDAHRPDDEEYEAAILAMEAALDRAAGQFPRPGRTDSIRRLTRTEYANAIRDLLDLQIDADALLPADEASHGFDNVTVGELSPTLLNRYITAAQKISRIAVGRKQRSLGGATYRIPADQTQDTHVEGLPLGTRGGTVIRHMFEQAGQYEIRLRLARDRDEHVEGLGNSHKIDVLLDRDRVYQFTVRRPDNPKDHSKVDADLHTRLMITAGPHDVGVTFPQTNSSLMETKRQPFLASYNRYRHPRREPAIFQISIIGPFVSDGPGDTPSRLRIFGEHTDSNLTEIDRAARIIGNLARTAYRRPINESDLKTPLAFFVEAADEQRIANRPEAAFESGIEAAIASILVNPNFLFRIESDPADAEPGQPYAIPDNQLASRLSFFLWSSLPDEKLLQLAEENQLSDPSVLRSQVTRMLNDRRCRSLVENFAAQWLYLRNLSSITPDLRRFPDFDNNLRDALRRETELLFQDVIDHDRSVLNLIQSDFTYLNERLAKHYGIPHVVGTHFRRVALSPESKRGGLLRHGSVLTVTSYATRTSPTIRGNWVLENILGTPAPPPPPNVPSLKDKTATESTSIRERLAQHRSDPACASCHNLMDPVGFALDHYDALGRWREFQDGHPIDSRGMLPDGTEIHGVDDLEQGVLQHPEMFVAAMTEKLLTFALGRGVEHHDAPAVRKIVRDASVDQYRFHSLIKAIVTSQPFLMRTAK